MMDSTEGEVSMAGLGKALGMAKALEEKASASQVFQMPLLPAGLVGSPNLIVRHALFNVMEHAKYGKPKPGETVVRAWPRLESAVVGEVKGPKESLTITFTGSALSQPDHDVFDCLLLASAGADVDLVTMPDGSTMMSLTAYELLRMLNRHKGANARTYTALQDSLLRLREGTIRIVYDCKATPAVGTFKGKKAIHLDLGGSLIFHGRSGEPAGARHLVRINPFLQTLFEPGHYSLIDVPLRLSLKKDLSKWLFGFYSSHAKPMPYSLQKLRERCGSTMQNKTRWRSAVVAAHEELVSIGFLKSFELEAGDVISVERASLHTSRGQHKALRPKAPESEVDTRQQSLI